MIGNSNINKIGSREVYGHFYAVDGGSRCMHVFKRLFGSFTSRQDKKSNIRRKTVARWFLHVLIASKKHENGRGGKFCTCRKTCDRDPISQVVSNSSLYIRSCDGYTTSIRPVTDLLDCQMDIQMCDSRLVSDQ